MSSILTKHLINKPDQAVSLLESEKEVMEMIAVGRPLGDILSKIALNYEDNTNSSICSILLLDDEGIHVRHGAGPSLPEAFNDGIDGEPIGPVAGSCGTAAFRKERVIVRDIATDPLWVNYRDFALSFGLKACWSTPILNPRSEVLGTFAIYYKECKVPTDDDLELIDRAASHVKIAMEHDRKEMQLRKSEESLRKSLERTTAIINAIPDLNFIIDKDGVIVDYQNRIGVTTFKKPEQFLNRKLESVLPSDLASVTLKNVRDVLNYIDVPLHYYQLNYPDGIREFEARYARMNDNEVLAIVRDLTMGMQAESKIKISEEKFRLSLDRITDGFASIDKDWRINYMNEKCGKLLQRDPEKMAGRKVFEEFPELYNKPWHEAATSAMLKQEHVYLEDYIEEIDRWFEDHFYPSEEGVSIYFRDITRKKKFEKERIERELQFTKLTSNVPVAIFQTDVFGQCTYVNPTWLAYAGMESEEAMGFGWSNAIHPDDKARVIEEWQLAVSAGKDFKSEFRFRHKNGVITWLDAKAVGLVDSEGNMYGHIGMASDISERKKIAGIIEESERRYRTTLERITDGFVALDKHWRYTYMNQTAGKIFGRDPKKMIGRHIWTEFPEGVGQPFHGAYMNAMLEQEYTYLEEYYPPYDKWFENHIYPSREGLSIYFKDITERKKAEAKIMESEEKYRTLIEQAADAIVLADKEGNYLDANESASILTGYTIEELRKMNGRDLIEEHDLAKMPLKIDEINKGGVVFIERVLRRKDKSLVNVEIRAKLMRSDKVNVIIRDVSERKLQEEERLSLLQRNKQTIDTMLDGFILADGKGNIIEVNPAYCQMVGYDSKELLNMNINQLEVLSTQEEIEDRIAMMMEKKSVQFEARHQRKDKVIIDLEVSISIMEINSQSVVAAFVRDITSRKKAQIELKRNHEQLRQLAGHLQSIREEERAALSRELHDELGQQLTAIKMDLSWLTKHTKTDDLLVNKIESTIKITNEAVSTIRRINSELRPTMLDDLGLYTALEYQLNEFGNRFNVKCQFDIEIDEPEFDRAKEIAVFRVFQEALTNVAKHAKAKNVRASIRKVSNNMELLIVDDGIGFDMSKVGDLKSFGLLGMTERAMMINGGLEFHSEPGSGTTIRLNVPL